MISERNQKGARPPSPAPRSRPHAVAAATRRPSAHSLCRDAEAGSDRSCCVWQAIEPVSLGLGGAGGEFLGGLWVLLRSWIALRSGAWQPALAWLGVVIGALGLASVASPLHVVAYGFGLLQIVWFVWIGAVLATTRASGTAPARSAARLA